MSADLKKLSEEIQNCNRCELYRTCKQKVIGKGSKNPKILFVLEAPGPKEDETGKLLMGESGNLFNIWIDILKILKEDYTITNICKCLPNENGRIRTPTCNEVEACSFWLKRQIDLLKPNIIVPVGKLAMQYFFNKKDSIIREMGRKYEVGGCKYFILAHPSFFLRSGNSWKGQLAELYLEVNGDPMPMKKDNILIYDLETTTADPETGRIKCMAYYSYKNKKLGVTRLTEEMKKIIQEHDVFVGYNNKKFDNEYLKKYGIYCKGFVLDLYDVAKRKNPILKNKFKNFKLKTVCKTCGLELKGEIPLEILTASTNSEEEWQMIEKYAMQDVNITKQLFEWFDEKFTPLLDFLPESSKQRWEHLVLSTGDYAYKVICNRTGIEEKIDYTKFNKAVEDKYEGAFVFEPTQETETGNIYCLDVCSEYPHAFMMQNLWSKAEVGYTRKTYKGNKLYQTTGTYKADKMGLIEKAVYELYKLRQKYKVENDPREYAIKIIINTCYGITGNGKFVNIYDKNAASDCTLTGRNWVKYMGERFAKEGYKVLYGDTDSVYIKDLVNDKQKMLDVTKEIEKEILATVPFPLDTFGIEVDEEISDIYFFKDEKTGKYKKKNYIFIRKNNTMKIKGLPIIKSNCTQISNNIYKKLEKTIINKHMIKFPKKLIDSLIQDEIKKDIKVLAKEIKVNKAKEYKNESSIQAQVLKKYGVGNHLMIKNIKIGIGKGVKYCTLEEAKTLQNSDFDLSTVYSELDPFIKKIKVKTLMNW